MLLGEEHGAVGQRCSTFKFARVDFQELTFVFQIVEDVSFAVGRGKFRAAAEIDGAGDFAAFASIAVALLPPPLKAKTR